MKYPITIEEARSSIPSATFHRLLPAGGHKCVFEGEHKGQRQAIKIAYVGNSSEKVKKRYQDSLSRFKREIEILRKCATPELVRLGSIAPRTVTIGAADCFVYSEEWLPGPSLYESIKSKQQRSETDLRAIAASLIRAEIALDKHGYVHRDIKPTNINVTGDPARPYVLFDLGVAYRVSGTQLTPATDGAPGTHGYRAPEHYRPSHQIAPNFRSDLFSIGVTIWEAATGQHPFVDTDDDDITKAERVRTRAFDPLSKKRPDLSAKFCEQIDQMMLKAANQRQNDLQSLLTFLEAK